MQKLFVLLLLAATVSNAQLAEIDLSETENVAGVLVLPSVIRVTSAPKAGGLIGVDTRKVTEKFEGPIFQKMVRLLGSELSGRVIPAATALGALAKNKVTPANVKAADSLAKMAAATKATWVVLLDGPRSNALFASLHDAQGEQVGTIETVTDAKNTDGLAKKIAAQLGALSKAKADEENKVKPPVPQVSVVPPPVIEEDVRDTDLDLLKKTKQKPDDLFRPDVNHVRALASVGPGGAIRNVSVSGDGLAALGQLQPTQPVLGFGAYVLVAPLKLIPSLYQSRFSDVFIDFNYRRAIVYALGIAGRVTGQRCSINDEEFSVRGGYKVKVLAGDYGTTVGLAGAFTQESTQFLCDFPALSTAYRGIDAQLKIRQPIYRDMAVLDFSGGPRFLLDGASATAGSLSFGGEAWLEVKPVSVLFTRAGVRISQLSLRNETIAATELRTFFALEIGVFL
jgi:hypothetical protein